jgi:hypothetical protein
MTKNQLLGVLAFGGVAAIISCDSGSGGATSGLASNDCRIGTFRPLGIEDCVFPATDNNGLELGVSDNRCATGQAAIPPQCVSDTGQRAYFSTSTTCAPGYRFLDGACNRNTFPTGSAGTFGTGEAGSFGTGEAGVTGASGDGAGGVLGNAGDFGILGQAGSDSTGAAGTGLTGGGATTGSAGATSSDASTDESSQ